MYHTLRYWELAAALIRLTDSRSQGYRGIMQMWFASELDRESSRLGAYSLLKQLGMASSRFLHLAAAYSSNVSFTD